MSEAAEITIKGLSDLAVGTYLLVGCQGCHFFWLWGHSGRSQYAGYC